MSSALASRRLPGQYTRNAVLRLRLRCLVLLGVFAVVTDLLGRLLDFRGVEFELAELGLLALCLVVLRFALPVVERLDRGASGEELVGGLLDELGETGWHVIHDAKLGAGNVDHIAVGPAGVFTFETKSNPGPIRVRRLHGSIIRQAQTQRDRVQRAAATRVEPFVVFSNAWVDRPGARRKGVRVVPARMLLRHLRHLPPALTTEQIGEIRERLQASLDA